MRVIEYHRAAGGSDNAYAPGDLRCIVAIESIKIVARIPLLNATASRHAGHRGAASFPLDGLYEGLSGTRASPDRQIAAEVDSARTSCMNGGGPVAFQPS